MGLGDIAVNGEDHADGVLGGGEDVAQWRIDDNDALFGGGRAVDVVDTNASTTDDLKFWRTAKTSAVCVAERATSIIVADDLRQ